MSKSDSLRLDDYLRHITEAIDRIQRYTDDMDEVAFLVDERTQDAVIRNFEIIGEAARNIQRHHEPFALAHHEIPWFIAYEMRNALANGYIKLIWRLSGRRFKKICPA